MKVESGMLVKTLSGGIVKTETQNQPGYWYCDDGRTYLAVTLREISDTERASYVLSHSAASGNE
jgi:hypothetical protein